MLKDILYEMGIKDAFSAHEADFTRMAELGVDNIYRPGPAQDLYFS